MASAAGVSGTGGVIVVECMCRGIKCVCVVESMYVLWNASFGICYAFSCIILAL